MARRTFLKRVLASAATYRVFTTAAGAQSDPFSSWNEFLMTFLLNKLRLKQELRSTAGASAARKSMPANASNSVNKTKQS